MKDMKDNSVVKILDAYKDAVYAKDIDAFLAIYDDNVRIFDTWGPGWIYEGIGAWHTMVEEWFGSLGSDRVVVEMEMQQIRQTSDLAFASAFVKYSAVSPEGDTLRSLQNRMTCVLEKKGNEWKITHEHTSSPVDGDTLKASLKR